MLDVSPRNPLSEKFIMSAMYIHGRLPGKLSYLSADLLTMKQALFSD